MAFKPVETTHIYNEIRVFSCFSFLSDCKTCGFHIKTLGLVCYNSIGFHNLPIVFN